MADPGTMLGGFLVQLFSTGSLVGIIGNLVASGLWDGGKWVRQLDTIANLFAENNGENHDLLRALRRAECQAMVLICDRLLRDDYGLRADSLPDRLEIRLRNDPEINTLYRIRRAYDRTYKELGSLSIDGLERMHGAAVANIPELIRSASECFKVASADEARKNIVDQQIAFFDQALRDTPIGGSLSGGLDPISPNGLPAKLKQRLEQHPQGWWDMLRLAFREELKNNQPAQFAWQMDVLSALPEQLGANYQDFEKKFDALDAKLDGMWAELKQLRRDFDGLLARFDELIKVTYETRDNTRDQLKLAHETKEAVQRLTPREPQKPPFELPKRAFAGKLFGRDRLLQDFTERLRRRENVDICGPAGMGKTALAAEAIRTVVGDTRETLADSPYRDSVVLLDLYKIHLNDDLSPAWNHLTSEFDNSLLLTDIPAAHRAAQACRGRHALVVVEGAEQARTGARLADILKVLDAETRWVVLTRTSAQVSTVKPIELDKNEALRRDDSLALLKEICGATISHSILGSLYEILGGHPLALTWSAHHVRTTNTPKTFLAELKSEKLPDIHEPGYETHTLRWLYKRSAALLSADAQRVLAAAGLLAYQPFPLGAAVAAATEEKIARGALTELVNHGFLQLSGDDEDQWEFTHALAHQFARETGDGASLAALGEWAIDYFDGAVKIAREFQDFSRLGQALNHAGALLRNDRATNTLGALSNKLLYGGFGRLDYARAASAAAHDWLTGALAQSPDALTLQRELSVSHSKLGDVERAAGNLDAARSTYEKSLAIRERLAKADANNSEWQRDLSVSHDKLGDVERATGNLDAARSAYEKSLAIAERLAKVDANNSEWQRDLVVSYAKIGGLFAQQSQCNEALEYFEKARAIAVRLTRHDPTNAVWRGDLAAIEAGVAQLNAAS